MLLPQRVHRLNEFSNISIKDPASELYTSPGGGGGGEKLKTPYHILSDGSAESSATG